MKKISSTFLIVSSFMVAGSFSFASLANAQTSDVTPTFYQNGTAVNPGGTPVSIGYYYLQNGDQVYYYGNGTYYDNVTDTYGGTVFGTAAPVTPGAPDTGMGGHSSENLAILVLTGLLFSAGSIYLLSGLRPTNVLS